MRVLAVVHGPDVGPALFGEVLAEDGHDVIEWDITRQDAEPPGSFDAVIVFGGAQNVGEELDHPWLHDEYDALRRWVARGTPLLGVCLGAQTLAHAVGGAVRRLPEEIVGFRDTELTSEGLADPVLGALPERFRAFNYNAYTFDVPSTGVELARGSVPQAFRVGERAWGVQFHPEVLREQALAWWDEEELPRPKVDLERELDDELEGWQELGRRLCRAFLACSA